MAVGSLGAHFVVSELGLTMIGGGEGHWTNQGLGFGARFSPSGHFIISLFGEWGLVLGTESSPHLRERERESLCFNYFF